MSLKYEKIEIKLVDNGTAIQIVNIENNTTTAPIKIDRSPEDFSEWLASELLRMNIISNKEDFREKFLGFLKGEKPSVPALVFQPAPVPSVPAPKPVVKPEVVPERVDITKYVEEEVEAPVVIPIKEEVKPEIVPTPIVEEKKIDSAKIIAKYQELYKKHAELEKYGVDVHQIIVKQISETENISIEDIEKIVPRVKSEVPLPTAQPIQPATQVQVPVQQQVPAISVPAPSTVTLPKEIEEELKSLPTPQRQMLERLSEYFKTDMLSMVARFYEEGENSDPPSYWSAVAYKYARSLGIVAPTSERVVYSIFADAKGNTYNVGLKRDIAKNVKIDYCYKLPITTEPVRCIARGTVTIQRDTLPEDVKIVESIDEIGNIPAIPMAIHFLKTAKVRIIDLYAGIKKSEQAMGMGAITGTIENVRSPKKGLYYFNVNDGSLRGVTRTDLLSVELPVPNPFGIDDNIMITAEGKDVFVYGTAILTLPSEKFSREGIKMKPMYIRIK